MAQPNVAREPSMEEILASIRKIIESNDVDAPKDFSSAASGYDADDSGYADDVGLSIEDETMATAAIFAANDEHPRSEKVQQPVDAPMRQSSYDVPAVVADQSQAAPKNVSLADLAARVRAAADRADPSMMMNNAARAEAPQPAPAPTRAPAQVEARGEPVPTQETARVSQPVRQPVPEVAPEVPSVEPAESPLMTSRLAGLMAADVPQVEAPLRPAMVEEPVRRAISEALGVPAPLVAEEPIGDNALVSAETGAHVAQSFSELAAAFDGVQNRSLDDMAEEMLRPMLKEWLDDNLPTLVERLVREEIERVARGPRR